VTDGRCPYVIDAPDLTRRPRDDGWRCGLTEHGPTGHYLYSADGERVLAGSADRWRLVSPADPKLPQ
jgi:hypothetical protein